jgi:hypothetical protein
LRRGRRKAAAAHCAVVTLASSFANRDRRQQFPIVSQNRLITFSGVDPHGLRLRVLGARTRWRTCGLCCSSSRTASSRAAATVTKEYKRQGWVYFLLSLRSVDGQSGLALEDATSPSSGSGSSRTSSSCPRATAGRTKVNGGYDHECDGRNSVELFGVICIRSWIN